MADEPERFQDAYEEREHEFVLQQGISEIVYAQLLGLAGAHAEATSSVASAPPWRFVGPRNLGGRIIALGQSPLDPRIIYAGSAHGGLWRSIDAGDTWERLGEAKHVFPVGAIAVAAVPATKATSGAPNLVYFGTGAHANYYVSGRGLYRATIDGPTSPADIELLVGPDKPTVTPVNATEGAALRYTRLRLDPDDPTRFWAASQTGLWRCECPRAKPAKPKFTRDFPDEKNEPAAAQLATTPMFLGLWPSHCTDLLVAHDPRSTATVTEKEIEVRRYLILFVAVHAAGVFRGRFDRKTGKVEFESKALELPTTGFTFDRIRLAQCERLPQHVYAIMARDRTAAASEVGSLLAPAAGGLPNQYRASNAADGSSPALKKLLAPGDKLEIGPAPTVAVPNPTVEVQTVAAVLNDTDVFVVTPFSLTIPPAGIAYRRATTSGRSSEVFYSSNSGDSWTVGAQPMSAVGALSGQAGYDLIVEVAPDDPHVVIGGEGEICISKDFGSHWEKILDWTRYDSGDKAQHADQHIAMFDRGDHRRLWVGNDGGLIVARDLRMPAQAYGYWRKRSHGIYAGQCQDVSINPSLPFMCGIGLQDNGTYLSLGGPTWYHVGGGDGGAVAFNLPDPRQFFVTWQGDVERAQAVAADLPRSATPNIRFVDLVTLAAGDIPESVARGHLVRYRWTRASNGLAAGTGPFVGVLEQHPSVAGSLLAGRLTDAYGSTNFGGNWTVLIPGSPPAVAATPLGEVCSLAFGPVDAKHPVSANTVDGWAGTAAGSLFFTSAAPGGTWAAVTAALPFPGAPLRISEIVVHPLDRRIVAVSATGLQGRVFLTYDRGRSWIDVTEPVPTALVVAPAGASVQALHTLNFTAIATYGTTKVNVTARAAWSSSTGDATAATATLQLPGPIVSGFGSEGTVTGVNAGTSPAIKATLLAGVPTGSASQAVTVTAGAAATPAPTIPPDKTIVPGSLPPGPVASVIFDPAPGPNVPARLLAGTLAGVYALSNVPVVKSLAIDPPGPLTFQNPGTFQLRCVATFTDNSKVDATSDVDWTDTPAVVTVTPGGLMTFVAPGAGAKITAHRAGQSVELTVNVQGAAAPLPVLGPAPAAKNPTVTVAWERFNNGLPDVLVTDFERVGPTKAIRAATFGLGVFECLTAGGPEQRLYIRQTVIENGHAPRHPFAVPDDPRLPANAVALDLTHAFDIRVDAPPYTFLDDIADGVEFDEQLEVSDPVPTEDNYVYVQVHNSGTKAVPGVVVHLYAAECAPTDVVNPIGPVPTPSPASLDTGAPIIDFYGGSDFEPIGGSQWKRVDGQRMLGDVPPDAPRVARFTWAPDSALQGKHVALLAVCSGAATPLSTEALPTNPAGATLSAFILGERRAALRIVRVADRPPASLYVRDGIADDSRLGGYPVAGRSPDIMVVHPDIAEPEKVFKDFLARRTADTVSGAVANVVYVRVHNRRKFDTAARVKVYAIGLDDGNRPSTDPSGWKDFPPDIPPVLPGFPPELVFAEVLVPKSGVGYARIELPAAADPNPDGTNKTYLLLALIQSAFDTDPLPDKASVGSVDTFWELVSRYADADNAAARAVPWKAGP